MGTSLLDYYKNQIKQEWKTAFFSAATFFLLVHLYKVTNTLPNHDSYYNIYTDQNMTGSGRWFLQYVCGISSFFDLDWLIGILCAVWLGIASAAVTELFGLKNPFVIALTGAILAACPSTTETMFFGYTADGYLLGLVLAAVSACLTCRSSKWQHHILGGILLCLSCAIYQSCVSFAIMLCICWLVRELLEERVDVRSAWKWVGRHVLIYAASMGAYYLIWKLILLCTGSTANDYQGINVVGQVGISTLLSGAVKSVNNLFFFFLEWNILEHPVTLYGILNIVFLLCFAGIVIVAIVRSGIRRRPGALVLLLLALAASVPMISVWCFLSEGVHYRPMMMHSAVLYYVLAIVLFDRWVNVRLSTVFGVCMCVMVFNFAVMANISYKQMNYCQQRTYYEGLEMMEIIDDAQDQYGDQIEAIAFTGSRAADVAFSAESPSNRNRMLSNLLEESLLFDHMHLSLYLSHTFGMDMERASEQEIIALQEHEDVRILEAFPENNCWTVIDNILVINLEDQR